MGNNLDRTRNSIQENLCKVSDYLSVKKMSYSSNSGVSKQHICLITIMFCFDEFAFTVQVKHKINSIQNSWLYFDMFVFYDLLFAHVYFAKNVAYFPFNSWLSF